MKNSTLVEVCTKNAHSYPAIQLEKENPSVNCIVYEIFTTDENKGEKQFLGTPNPYGSMYFKKWTRSMNSDDHRLPRTVLQRQQLDFHSYKDQTGKFNGTVWIEETTSSLHGLSIDQAFVIESFQFDVEGEMYTLSLSLKCMEDFPQEEWDYLCYNMFLKPDILFEWLPWGSTENIAYDFIPFHLDTVEKYDGIGFPLSSYSTDAPTKENPFIRLKSQPFLLPTFNLTYSEDIFSNPPETRPPNWSLHLILNDSRDMRKNLYSWTLPIQIEEES